MGATFDTPPDESRPGRARRSEDDLLRPPYGARYIERSGDTARVKWLQADAWQTWVRVGKGLWERRDD